jgi:hypothetical protein
MSDAKEARLRLLLKDVLWDSEKGGLVISRVPGANGFYIYSMTRDVVHRPPTGAELRAIDKNLPKLGAVAAQAARRLTRGEVKQETVLRAQMLEDFLEDHREVASLDKSKPTMPDRSQVSALDRSTLPKAYMGIDRAAGVLNIQMSELTVPGLGGTGKVRPDAFLMQVDLEPQHLAFLDGGGSLQDLLKNHKFEDPRAMYFDDNLPLKGAAAKEHHKKSIATMMSAVTWVLGETDLKVSGQLHVSVTDQWRDHAVLHVTGKGGRRWRRDIDPTTGKQVQESSRNRFFAWGRYELQPDAGGIVRPVPARLVEKHFVFIDGLKGMKGELNKVWNETNRAMRDFLKKMK